MAARNAAPVLVVSPHAALTGARTAGVRLFERRPPVHSVLLGRARLEAAGRPIDSHGSIALPANTAHTVLELQTPFACVAYLDARRYRFEDAQRLAEVWSGFVPGQDDLREAMGDALRVPERRVDARVLRALAALETGASSVREAAARVGLSESRLTHLTTDTLGAPPRIWRAWFKLQRALHATLFSGQDAHASRTHRRLRRLRAPHAHVQTPDRSMPSPDAAAARSRRARVTATVLSEVDLRD